MRGDGRIYLRGQVFWVCYYLRGKQYREPARTKDDRSITDAVEAGKFLRNRMKEVHADEIGARTFTTPKALRVTIRELCDALQAEFVLRDKWSDQNKSHLKRVRADFGDALAMALTAEKIDSYIETRLAEGNAKATINRTTQMLGQAYALAIRRGELSRAPYIRHLSEADNIREDCFSEAQFSKVVENLPADLRGFVRFAAVCGVRSGELRSYRWEMLRGETLHVPGTICKNKKGRVLPLAGEMLEIVERQKARRKVEVDGVISLCPFIFHRDGECGSIGEFRKSWKTALRKAGLSGYRFHGLRRFAAVAQRDAGIPQVVSMKITGHKTDSMWRRYSIVDETDMREALARVAEFRKAAK